MPIDDPNKLEQAIEQLEAERERRIQAKLEAGEAVRGIPAVVGGAEDIGELPSRDSEGREIVFGADDITHIITGVPRAGRDDKYIAAIGSAIERGEYEAPNKPLAYQPPVETSKTPAPSKPTPQPERPPEPRRIVAQVRECLDNDDAGEIVEGFYDVKGGILYVWDAQNNSPLGNQPIKPGDNIEFMARKLLREKSGKHSSFYQPIRYPAVRCINEKGRPVACRAAL